MNNTCVVTIAIGEEYKRILELSKESIKKYADKIKADFVIIDKQELGFVTPQWEKFRLFNLLNLYKRIIYLDCDLIVREDTPNLFEIVPKNKIGLYDESPFTPRSGLVSSMAEQLKIKLEDKGNYYNTGVIVVSRKHKYLFEKPDEEINNFFEQTYFNVKLLERKEEVFKLDYKFNRMSCIDKFTGISRLDSYIVHYAGCPSLSLMSELIKKDIDSWNKDKPVYAYKQRIFVSVSGGIGDQCNAQPSIRFMREKVFSNAEIIVETHYPQLFKDIEGIDVFKQNEFVPENDTPYFLANSFPNPETLTYSVIGTILSHTIDYCSIALLKRILPFNDKSIKLNVSLKDIQKVIDVVGITDLRNLVVIHAGKHWDTKTMPKEWWEEIIDGLLKENMTVCLIGKSEELPAVHDIQKEGVINLVDLLDLDGLIALLSQAKVLVSNDSAPIHLAGAFDNWIIAIPTVKHPDHILPFRNGVTTYKTKALYKKLVLDDYPTAPTEVNEISISKMVYSWDRYLLEPKEIVKAIKEVV